MKTKLKAHLLHRILTGRVQMEDLTATFRRVIQPGEVQYFKDQTPIFREELLASTSGMTFRLVRKPAKDTVS